MKKTLLTIALLLTTNIMADETSPLTTIKYVYSTTSAGKPFISLGADSMPGCHGNNGGYLNVDDEKATERTFSMILSALAAKQQVRVYFSYNNTPADYTGWGMCNINAVSIQ